MTDLSFRDFKGVDGKLNTITSLYPPGRVFLHRDKELQDITLNLAPVMSNQKASNFFVCGGTGTGKTGILCAKLLELEQVCKEEHIDFSWAYVNCAETLSGTSSLLKICKQISPTPESIRYGNQWSFITATFEELILKNTNLVIVLDEVDKLIEAEGDKLLYYLTRLKDNSNLHAQNVCVVMVSNNVNVPSMLSPRTESSFGKLKVEFFSYDALQLTDILSQRIAESGIGERIGGGVVNLIASYGAQLHGNARQTLELLKNCYLSRRKSQKITLDVVREVYERMEHDLFTESVARLPSHQKLLLLAIFEIANAKSEVTTAAAYENYNALCSAVKKTPVGLRRLQQITKSLTSAGIIQAKKSPGFNTEKTVSVSCPTDTFFKVHKQLKSTYFPGAEEVGM